MAEAALPGLVASAARVLPTTGAPAEPPDGWALVAPYRERLLALVRPWCASAQDAEDCVQDALVQVATHPAIEQSTIAGLLSTVALRRARDLARAQSRHSRRLARLATDAIAPRSPEDIALDRIQARVLIGHSERLARKQREVLARRVAGMTCAETAHDLQITPRAEESAFRRARLSLRLMWTAMGGLVVTVARRFGSRPRSHQIVLASAAVAMVAAVGVVVVPAHQPAARSAAIEARFRPYPSLLAQPPVRHEVGLRQPPHGSGPGSGGGAQLPSSHSAAPASQTTTVVGRVGVPGVVSTTGPVTTGRDHGDKSMLQSLQDCLHGGLAVSPTVIGCPG